MTTFLLIDASNQLHRAYHGCPVLTSTSGIETHALMSWVSLLSAVIERANLPPDTKIVVFWDKKVNNTPGGEAIKEEGGADELWFSYKGTRVHQNPGLYDQITLAMAVTKLLGIAYVAKAGVEADGLLGSFVLSRPDDRHFILSSDKDMLQLVNDRVSVIAQHNSEFKTVGPEQVRAKWGVDPSQMADMLIMMGDKSDNIPGIPGIGQKTAQEMLNRFGSLDEVLRNVEAFKPKQRQNLLESIEQIPVLRRLIEFTPAEVRVRQIPPEFKAAKNMLESLQMDRTIQRIASMQVKHMKNPGVFGIGTWVPK